MEEKNKPLFSGIKNKLLWNHIEMQKLGNGGYAIKYQRDAEETVMGAYEFHLNGKKSKGRYVLDHAQGDFFCFYYTPIISDESGDYLENKESRYFKVRNKPEESDSVTQRKPGEIPHGIRKKGKDRYTVSHVEGDTFYWDLV